MLLTLEVNFVLFLIYFFIFCFGAIRISYLRILILFMVQRCVLLDIEGTTTPMSFCSDVLVPFAHDYVGKHLSATYDSEETQNDINLLRSQVRLLNVIVHLYSICD